MTRDRDAKGKVELEWKVREVAEDAAPDLVALAYTEPSCNGSGRLHALTVADRLDRGA